jgi:hypothetical protein
MIWGEDSSGNFALFNAANTKQAAFDSAGGLVIFGRAQPSSATVYFSSDSGGDAVLNAPTGQKVFLAINAAATFGLAANAVTQLFGINSAGLGIPGIYASSVQSKSNAAPTTVSYTPPATAGTYRANVYVEITTATAITLKLKITYTSASGAATTDVVELTQEGSNSLVNAPANTADRFWGVQPINIDNSAGAIALADNAGTYTTCAYRLAYWLEQVI